MKVYRARVMVIGQARAGKTSLIKSLLGLPFEPKEDSTVGIDPSSCRIDVDQAKDWQRTDQGLDVSQYADELASEAAKELVQKETEVDLPDQDMPEENRSHTSQVGYNNWMCWPEYRITLLLFYFPGEIDSIYVFVSIQ